jgi:hypothetical protein
MTENLKIGVSVHLTNSSGFVAQKNRPETNLRAVLAEGDEKQVFFVRQASQEYKQRGWPTFATLHFKLREACLMDGFTPRTPA